MRKFLRRYFNKDERVGESILSKINDSIIVETRVESYQYDYFFNLDGFDVNVSRRVGMDMTSGSSWYEYYIKVDGMYMSVSEFTTKSIFNKFYELEHREESENKEFLYKDIKSHFS